MAIETLMAIIMACQTRYGGPAVKRPGAECMEHVIKCYAARRLPDNKLLADCIIAEGKK